jgi:beta-lactamase regulating signal transducer with metallopeptidase domain
VESDNYKKIMVIIGVLTIIIGVLAIIVTITVPEIRHRLELEPNEKDSNKHTYKETVIQETVIQHHIA